MAKVIIVDDLLKQISKKFSRPEADIIVDLMMTLENNPHKGKEIGCINGVLIKELKYKKFRFYFLVDGYSIKVLSVEELQDMIIKFIMMSEKKNQISAISELKEVLRGITRTINIPI